MNKEEFKKFVLEEAKKYLNKDINIAPEKSALKNEAIEEKLNKDKSLDPVGDEDADVNNDGKVDSQDSYLKKRRKTIGKAIDKEEDMKESISPKQIAKLAEELKKLNKSFDFRNPVVPTEENIVDAVINESKEVKTEEASVKEEKSIFSEHKKQWKNLLDYKVPSDEERKNY